MKQKYEYKTIMSRNEDFIHVSNSIDDYAREGYRVINYTEYYNDRDQLIEQTIILERECE